MTNDLHQMAKDISAGWALAETCVDAWNGRRGLVTQKYLPRFTSESEESYKGRLRIAKCSNVFRQAIRGLVNRPFSRPVVVNGQDEIKSWAENVDGRGADMHQFAKRAFESAVVSGWGMIVVDYPPAPENLTEAEARRLSLRPYALLIEAKYILEVRSEYIGGNEQIIYLRYYAGRASNGTDTGRIRIMEMRDGKPVWSDWERMIDGDEWLQVASGQYVGMDELPLVPLMFADRDGMTWAIEPPMIDAADAQVELMQAETDHKHTMTLTAHPMLVGRGVRFPDKMRVGPSQALSFEPVKSETGHMLMPEVDWISPGAAELEHMAKVAQADADRVRELAMQPLVQPASARLVAAVNASERNAMTQAQAWAHIAAHAMTHVCVLAARWMDIEADGIDVSIHTDFTADLGSSDFKDVLAMYQDGALSLRTLLAEAKRRSLLAPNVDIDREEAEVAAALEPLPSDMQGGEG